MGEEIRAYRKAAGKTQAAVARDSGFSEQYIYQIEKGDNKPLKVSTLILIASAIDAPLDTLIDAVVQDRIRETL